MKSMTGFGSATASDEKIIINCEVSSVNRKALEINVSLPREWQVLETTLFSIVKNSVSRGKVSIYFKHELPNQQASLFWDEEDLSEIISRLESSAEKNGTKFELSTDLVFQMAKTLAKPSELPKAEEVQPLIEEALNKSLEKLVGMRQNEGLSLKDDLKGRLKELEEKVNSIKSLCGGCIEHYKEQLFARLEKSGLEFSLDDERILKEISLFADKCDISEELTRLQSHLGLFGEDLNSNEPIGRKMDFICQEINRELNTIGSKTNLLEITHVVINSKNELERIREQVQNIE